MVVCFAIAVSARKQNTQPTTREPSAPLADSQATRIGFLAAPKTYDLWGERTQPHSIDRPTKRLILRSPPTSCGSNTTWRGKRDMGPTGALRKAKRKAGDTISARKHTARRTDVCIRDIRVSCAQPRDESSDTRLVVTRHMETTWGGLLRHSNRG